MVAIKDKEESVLTEERKIKRRWHEYFKELLNEENERDRLENVALVSGPVEEFSEEEVKKAVKEMKSGKTPGPSGISADYFKYLDSDGLKWLTELLNTIFEAEKNTKGLDKELSDHHIQRQRRSHVVQELQGDQVARGWTDGLGEGTGR